MNDIPLDILERASCGDLVAFEELYKLTSGFVYNVALRVIRNSSDAEEVTQDVFMKLYNKLKDFGFRSAFKTWVYRITVNTALNHSRKFAKEVNNRVDFDSRIELLPADSSSAEDAIRQDNEDRLDKLLGALSQEHRVCLVLREIEGLSYAEIAETLNIPVNTVRSRLKRAREALLESRKGLVKNAL